MKNVLTLLAGALFVISSLTGCCTKAKTCPPPSTGKTCCPATKGS